MDDERDVWPHGLALVLMVASHWPNDSFVQTHHSGLILMLVDVTWFTCRHCKTNYWSWFWWTSLVPWFLYKLQIVQLLPFPRWHGELEMEGCKVCHTKKLFYCFNILRSDLDNSKCVPLSSRYIWWFAAVVVPELETGNGFFGNKSFGKETAGKNHVYIHVLWQIRI